jgi:metallo-beta-lactamase class B
MNVSRPNWPRRWLVGGLTLLILAAVVVVGYRRHTGRREDAEAAAPHVLTPKASTIVPGIHLLGGLAPAAAYVVETSEGLILIDAGLRADLVKREMASLKLDWRRLRAILLTHVHGDHCGGAQELRAATGAKLYAGRGDAAVLRAGAAREVYFSTFPMTVPTPGPTTVDVELDGEETIVLGDTRITALATPGHTPGSVCYRMERGEQRALFSGDILWALSDEGTPLGTYAAYLAPRYRGDVDAFLATLRRLRAMPAPQLLLPGHPRNDPVPQRPNLSQERWEAILDAGIRDMEQLKARYARDGTPFLDGVPRQLLPDLYYLGDFQDVAVYGLLSSSRLILVNAPGGPGLRGFVNARLEKLGLKPIAPAAIVLTSGDPEVSAGLVELNENHPLIVAPEAAWETIKKACPTEMDLLTPEQLARKGWFPVTPISLGGRGIAPMAYRISWARQTVLLTGRMPLKASQARVRELLIDLAHDRVNRAEYRSSLERLRQVKPDLWLPAFPTDGQNAHLYDRAWRDVLTGNDKLLAPATSAAR